MRRVIDYYFSLVSPWAYLGSARLHAMARKHDAAIAYHPVPLLEVFKETGGLPLSQRPPARRAYRLSEMQRWRDHLKLPLLIAPKHFPFDAALADRCIMALLASGANPEAYITAAHHALWAEDRNLGDEAVLASLLSAAGHDAAATLAAARQEETGARYAANREAALAAGVFGAPSYVLKGEIFWGQDRLEMLESALASNRAPFLPSTAGV